MAMDWEYFFKQGLMPLFGGTQDIIGANLQSQLARQRHQQEMQQLGEMYKLRGEEQEKGHEQTMEELGERERIAGVEDVMERNRLLLRASYNIWEAEKTAQIHMKTTKYEENLKHEHAIEEITARLREYDKANPGKMMEIISSSILRSQQAIALLDESDRSAAGEIEKLTSIVNQDPKTADQYRVTPAEKETANRRLVQLEGQLQRNAQWRQTIDNQMKLYAQNGATDAGVIPPDRVAFLKNVMKSLEDKLSYHGKTLTDIPTQELLPALQQHAIESGLEEGLSAADLKFILANYLSDLKANFVKPKKK